jgi:hypothetical protein
VVGLRSEFNEIRYMWRHSQPHTKRMRRVMGMTLLAAAPASFAKNLPHLPHWLSLTISIISIFVCIWLIYELLRFLGAEFMREMMEKDEKLSKLLDSPDLDQRFSALSLQLRSDGAEQLSKLQEAMKFGAREAKRLADQIRESEGTSSDLLRQQQEYQHSAETLADLLDSEVGRVAEIIERKGRISQWTLIVVGAILGVILQGLAQWIF